MKSSLPYLLNNTSRDTTAILAAVWFRKHGSGSYGAFMGEVIRKSGEFAMSRPRIYGVKRQRHKDTLHIARYLSEKTGGEFLLPTRELQMRLLLPTPMTAWRILSRLVELGHLEVVDAGLSRPAASAKGEKASAARYRLKSPTLDTTSSANVV